MTLTRRGLTDVADELEAVFAPEAAQAYRPRYNLAPTDTHYVLRLAGGERRLEPARWGFPPSQAGRPPLFNARADTAPTKDAFRAAFFGGRCVVPADGFFEWRGRTPLWFHRRDGRLLLLAGLWDAGHFTVLTTEPNALVAEVHDRMPVILSEAEAAAWLAAPSQELLHPAPDDVLVATPVSDRVSSIRHDDPQCLAPAAQLSLF
jgi:putative SOS response-associated peptidase YedK